MWTWNPRRGLYENPVNARLILTFFQPRDLLCGRVLWRGIHCGLRIALIRLPTQRIKRPAWG